MHNVCLACGNPISQQIKKVRARGSFLFLFPVEQRSAGSILRRDNCVPAGVVIVTEELILHRTTPVRLGSHTVHLRIHAAFIERRRRVRVYAIVDHFGRSCTSPRAVSFCMRSRTGGRNTNNTRTHRPTGPCAFSVYATRPTRAPQRLHSTNVPRRHGGCGGPNFFLERAN
jgi:hypothetical protein